MQRQIKKKHHYIPRFHLRRWIDEDGKLLIYRKDGNGKIEYKKKYPSQVCFQNELYSLKKEQFDSKILNKDYVENELAKIDDKAANILTKIINSSSLSDLTNEDKEYFAVYIHSLLQRHPEKLESLEEVMSSLIENTLNDIKKANEQDTLDTWNVCENFFKSSNYCENQIRVMLLSVIKSKEWIEDLLKFEWNIVVISENFQFKFILTEQPVVTIGGNDNIGFLAVALTPRQLLIAFPHNFKKSEDIGDLIKNVVMLYNIIQLSKKPKFIISSDELNNDGFHNYNNIFKDCVKHIVGNIEETVTSTDPSSFRSMP